jgi:hypothetical protein
VVDVDEVELELELDELELDELELDELELDEDELVEDELVLEVLDVVHVMWVWLHVPRPSHPAVVHESASVSVHGVLSGTRTCVWLHVPWPSQPAVVHSFPSVSGQGVLFSCVVVYSQLWRSVAAVNCTVLTPVLHPEGCTSQRSRTRKLA